MGGVIARSARRRPLALRLQLRPARVEAVDLGAARVDQRQELDEARGVGGVLGALAVGDRLARARASARAIVASMASYSRWSW